MYIKSRPRVGDNTNHTNLTDIELTVCRQKYLLSIVDSNRKLRLAIENHKDIFPFSFGENSPRRQRIPLCGLCSMPLILWLLSSRKRFANFLILQLKTHWKQTSLLVSKMFEGKCSTCIGVQYNIFRLYSVPISTPIHTFECIPN